MNGFLAKMGYGPADRVLITHIDDLGFSHAANVAGFECLAVGGGDLWFDPGEWSLVSGSGGPGSGAAGLRCGDTSDLDL